MRTFLDKQKPKEFVDARRELPEVLKESFQEQERQYQVELDMHEA